MSKLQISTRKPGESIAAFGNDLLLMAQKAYANLDSDAQEMFALQQFYQAVPLENALSDNEKKAALQLVKQSM